MLSMYFSGVDNNIITYDDTENLCIRVNLDLFIRVLDNNKQNTRVFLDTHLLKIRGNEDGQERPAEKPVSKGNASVDLGNMPSIPVLVYTSRALITAEFREMSSDDFKEIYLAPLDNALRESNVKSLPLEHQYKYPLGDAMHVEQAIQWYFNEEIARTIKQLYRDVGDITSYFVSPSFVRPPLDRKRMIQPDIIHTKNKLDSDMQYRKLFLG